MPHLAHACGSADVAKSHKILDPKVPLWKAQHSKHTYCWFTGNLDTLLAFPHFIFFFDPSMLPFLFLKTRTQCRLTSYFSIRILSCRWAPLRSASCGRSQAGRTLSLPALLQSPPSTSPIVLVRVVLEKIWGEV